MTGLRVILRRLRWYLREFTGEAEYDRYSASITGVPALSRRQYERMRARHQERRAHSRCC